MGRAEQRSIVAKVRVYELAKEFGVESKAVMGKLEEMGEFVRSASSTIEAPVVRRLKEAFNGGGAAKSGSASGGRDQGRPGGQGNRNDRPRPDSIGQPAAGGIAGSAPAPSSVGRPGPRPGPPRPALPGPQGPSAPQAGGAPGGARPGSAAPRPGTPGPRPATPGPRSPRPGGAPR